METAQQMVENAAIKENGGIASILYAQKKAESIANTEGVQFPNSFAFDSVNHNIADIGLKVKPQTETSKWLYWIQEGKALYLNKEKIQNLINQQRRNLADVAYLDLDAITNIVDNFQNPTVESEKDKDCSGERWRGSAGVETLTGGYGAP